MNEKGFSRDALLGAWDNARAASIAAMNSAVSNADDALEAVLAPDREAAEWLCQEELAEWRRDKAMTKIDSLFWGICFAFLILLFLGAVAGQIHFTTLWAKVPLTMLSLSIAVATLGAAVLATDSARDFYQLRSHGCSRGAFGIVTSSGYSMWGVSKCGIYVAHEPERPSAAPQIGFYRFDEIKAPTIDLMQEEIAISLFSSGGRLIRVIIVPRQMNEDVTSLIRLLCQKISF